jgi:hypothetical protein
MPLKSNVSEFCENRGITGQVKSAFSAWIRARYADKFGMKESGETVHVILNRMSQDDLADAWLDFVQDLSSHLTKSLK